MDSRAKQICAFEAVVEAETAVADSLHHYAQLIRGVVQNPLPPGGALDALKLADEWSQDCDKTEVGLTVALAQLRNARRTIRGLIVDVAMERTRSTEIKAL